MTWAASLPPFPYTASFTADWLTERGQHLVLKLSLPPGTYQISVLPDLMVLTTATGPVTTADDVVQFLEEGVIGGATVVRTVNSWGSNGQYQTGEYEITRLLSSPDTLATQAMQDAGISPNYGDFSYYTGNVSIEAEKTITYPSGARDVYTADYYLDISGWNGSYIQQPSGMIVPSSGRVLVTIGNPTGQRTEIWGGNWLNIQSIYEIYRAPDIPIPPAVDLNPQALPETINFATTADGHGVQTPPIADTESAEWWRGFGQNVLLGYSSQALSALRKLADAAGHYSLGATLDIVNAATTAVGVRDFLNGLVAKIWAHDAEGIQLILNPNTTSAQIYEWGAQDNQIRQDAAQGARDQAISIPLDQVVPGGGTVYSVYTSMPQLAKQENSFSLGLLVPGLQASGSEKSDVVSGGTGADSIQLGAGNDLAMGFEGNDVISAGDGRDWLCGGSGDDLLDGGNGVDTAAYYANRAGYAIAKTGSSWSWSVRVMVGVDGTDTLQNIERIKFSDGAIALDVGATQPAGQTAMLLGAVLPGRLVFDTSKQALLGAVIDLFDQGYSLQTLSGAVMRLPIWDVLTGKATPSNTDIATYLLTNVNGTAPNAATLANAVTSLNTETDFASQGNFLWHLAESATNQTRIDLVGLAATGLAYL
jgi:hypothetical protein